MLKQLMIKQGYWLFRWRSYLPLVMFPLAIDAFLESGWMTRRIGPFGEDVWDTFCLLVAAGGLLVRVLTVGFVPHGTSGRKTSRQQADRLNTTGMYSVIRHPVYLGNFLVFLGVILLFKDCVFAIFATIIYVVYYERIILAEEDFLARQHGAAFHAWAEKTPVIAPTFRNWVPPDLPFSWRTALRREFHTLFLVGVLFFVIEMLEGIVIEQMAFRDWAASEPLWPILAAASAVIYVIVRLIKKRTKWLAVRRR